MQEPFLTLETRPGNPQTVGQIKFVPFAQVLRLRLPVLRGGLIWNRPVSVLVTTDNGQEQILQVRDYTRNFLWMLFGVGLLGGFLISWISRRKDRSLSDE